ncbi:MAG: hypothetical protein COV46_03015, partial [Deltaproteobacteria bacterium CG11_big_fil_rev_8_21_14_0_20_49_13]
MHMLLIENAAISTGEKNKTRQADIYVEDGKIVDVCHCDPPEAEKQSPETGCGGLLRYARND